MSAEAIAALQRLWGKLTFGSVVRVIAREPEDVLEIKVPNIIKTDDGLLLTNGTEYVVPSRRTKDVPAKDWWRCQVAWRHYYGFTETGIFFQRNGYCELDFDISHTLDFSSWGNHQGGWKKPQVGSLIYGEVEEGEKGKRFKMWFVCPPEVKLLMEFALHGTGLAGISERDLAGTLISGCGWPDIYWAIARLVFFDSVQPFVDQLKKGDDVPAHPCYGQEYPSHSYLGSKKPRVYWRGMYLPREASQFVHELSFRLNSPEWWQEFVRLADEQGIKWQHPAPGGVCDACEVQWAMSELRTA